MTESEIILQAPVESQHRELFNQKKAEYQKRKDTRVVELRAQYQAPELLQHVDRSIAYLALSIFMMDQLEAKQSLMLVSPEVDTELVSLTAFREALPGVFSREDWPQLLDRVIGNIKAYSDPDKGVEKLKEYKR